MSSLLDEWFMTFPSPHTSEITLDAFYFRGKLNRGMVVSILLFHIKGKSLVEIED